jgi:hypothetical protein
MCKHHRPQNCTGYLLIELPKTFLTGWLQLAQTFVRQAAIMLNVGVLAKLLYAPGLNMHQE